MTTSTLAAWLWTFLLHSSVLLVAAWVITRVARSLSLASRERLWWTASLGGLLTATLAVAMPLGSQAAPIALLPQVAAPHLEAAQFTEPVVEALLAEGLGSTAPLVPFSDLEAPSNGGMATPDTTDEKASAPPIVTAHAAAPVPATPTWPLWIGALWALGLGWALLRMWRDERGLRAALRDRRPCDDVDFRREFAALVGRAGLKPSRVRLSISSGLVSPVAWGTLRGEVCLPERALHELPTSERTVMLAHEIAHLRRHDGLALRVRRTLLALFFFQPLLRVADRRLHDLAELRCDAWAADVTGERTALAACLARVAGWLVGRPQSIAAPAMACRHSTLEHRVGRLLHGHGEGATGLRTWFLALSVLASVVVLLPRVGTADEAPPTTDISDAGAPTGDRVLVDKLQYRGTNFTLQDIGGSGTNHALKRFFLPGTADGEANPSQAMTTEMDALQRELDALLQLMTPLRENPQLAPLMQRLEARVQRLRDRHKAWAAGDASPRTEETIR